MGGILLSINFLSVLFIGFILGIKHSIEPDHIIAVTTGVTNSKKLISSTLTGVFWGIGHTITLLVFGVLIVLMKSEISEKWAMSLEFLVGIMLVILGVRSILFFENRISDHNVHSQIRASYIRSVFIGFIHGLAGSAAMILLTMSVVSSIWECIIYISVFGVGTILGMLCFTTVIGIPFVFSNKNIRLNGAFTRLAGTVSLIFGIYYMYNLGITEGLFQLWVQ